MPDGRRESLSLTSPAVTTRGSGIDLSARRFVVEAHVSRNYGTVEISARIRETLDGLLEFVEFFRDFGGGEIEAVRHAKDFGYGHPQPP